MYTRRRKGQRNESLFKQIGDENFLNLLKELYPQIQEANSRDPLWWNVNGPEMSKALNVFDHLSYPFLLLPFL